MKVSDLKIGQSVVIDSKNYHYMGVQKIKKPGYRIQKVVFAGAKGDRHYDLPVGSKELTVTKDKIELK